MKRHYPESPGSVGINGLMEDYLLDCVYISVLQS